MLLDLMDDNITTTFFKCTRWQVEETTDLFDCRYHYFCDSTYPADYSPIVDLSVLLFAVASYVSLLWFSTAAKYTNSSTIRGTKRRYLIPSGPFLLPVIIFILSRGLRFNTMFSLSSIGPALLQLVYVSALAFENQDADKKVQYAVLEASTVSGIMHASFYVDSIILPYYTGLEALMRSRFSGECESCVCMEEALVVGGTQILYRGWSMTTLSVVTTLCARMWIRGFGEEQWSLVMKMVLEGMSWVLVAWDSVYLMMVLPQGILINRAAYGGICVLISLNVLSKLYRLLGWLATSDQIHKIDICQYNV